MLRGCCCVFLLVCLRLCSLMVPIRHGGDRAGRRRRATAQGKGENNASRNSHPIRASDNNASSVPACPSPSFPLPLLQYALQLALAAAPRADVAPRVSERTAVDIVIKLMQAKKMQVQGECNCITSRCTRCVVRSWVCWSDASRMQRAWGGGVWTVDFHQEWAGVCHSCAAGGGD